METPSFHAGLSPKGTACLILSLVQPHPASATAHLPLTIGAGLGHLPSVRLERAMGPFTLGAARKEVAKRWAKSRAAYLPSVGQERWAARQLHLAPGTPASGEPVVVSQIGVSAKMARQSRSRATVPAATQ